MSQFLEPEDARLDPALAALSAGSRVGSGRFTLLRVLGRGGMGVVWLARDEQLREGVALKFLPPEIRHDAAALDDLRRETSRSRKLTHTNIIRIHDLFQSEKEAFISMEYVDGPNLTELRLEQPQRLLQWSFLEPLIKELCLALDYAHSEHIVHRDLKPANMMLDVRGRLKLADFGIAAVVTDSFSRVTMTQYLMGGTACYMSPQQLDGQPPQVTDDIYSIGATLYELLASRAPFFAGDIAHQVRTFPAQPIEKRLAQLNLQNAIPPAVISTIMSCLAKDPASRPQSARAVAEQIGLGPLTTKPRTDASAPPQSVSLHADALRAPPEPPPRTTREPQPVAVPAPATPVTAAFKPVPPVKEVEPTPEPLPAVATAPGSSAPSRKRGWPLVLAAVIVLLSALGVVWWWSQNRAGSSLNAVAPAAPEFVQLFNGYDFSGWDGDPQVWFIKDGAITATNATSKERRPLALFWRGGNVADFELHVSFRLLSGNSGIYYRAKQLLGYEVGGYQFEIIGPATGTLIETGPDRTRRQPSQFGSMTRAEMINGKEKVTVLEPTSQNPDAVRKAFKPGAWNEVVVTVQSNHIVHKLNGQTIIASTDLYSERPRMGTIALEVYGSVPTAVQFKNIKLKDLTPPPAPIVSERR